MTNATNIIDDNKSSNIEALEISSNYSFSGKKD